MAIDRAIILSKYPPCREDFETTAEWKVARIEWMKSRRKTVEDNGPREIVRWRERRVSEPYEVEKIVKVYVDKKEEADIIETINERELNEGEGRSHDEAGDITLTPERMTDAFRAQMVEDETVEQTATRLWRRWEILSAAIVDGNATRDEFVEHSILAQIQFEIRKAVRHEG